VPTEAPELEPYLDGSDVRLVRFGPGGDVGLERFEPPALTANVGGARVELEVPFTALHHAHNTLAALAAYAALGLPLDRAAKGAPGIRLSLLRGEEIELPAGAVLINDCYNANPVSMRAALEHLVRRAEGRRTIAVLGEMAELGKGAPGFHADVGTAVRELGVDVVVAVGGDLAAAYGGTLVTGGAEAAAVLRELLRPGDVVLVKASRAMRLETVAETLTAVTA
jgi:UDP-N-acetylmuramoyl-tripeptide--D-alanyl-D-alanine ligase